MYLPIEARKWPVIQITPGTKRDPRLDTLIQRICQQWSEFRHAWRNAVLRAIRMGELLAELKTFERWHDFLGQLEIPEPTANLAIRFFKHKDKILAELKKNPVLTFAGARALIPRERASGAGRKPKQPPAPKVTLEGNDMPLDGERMPLEAKVLSERSRTEDQVSQKLQEGTLIAKEGSEKPRETTEATDLNGDVRPAWWGYPGQKALEQGEQFTKLKRQGLTIAEIAEKEGLEFQFVRNCMQCLRVPKVFVVESTLGEALEELRRREDAAPNVPEVSQNTEGTHDEAPSEQSTPEAPLKNAEEGRNAKLDALRNELLTWCAKHEGDIQFLRLPVGTATVNVQPGKLLLVVPELAVAPMAK